MIMEIDNTTSKTFAGLAANATDRIPAVSSLDGLQIRLSHTSAIRPKLGFVLLIIFAVLLSLWTGQASAQLATAEINGTVHDQTAALVPGATVTVTQVDTGVVTTTTANGEGIFVFSTLPVGTYTLNITAPGFDTYRQTTITLTVGQHLTVDASLKIGVSDQVVTVSASSVALDSSSPTEQSVIEQKIVENLPLNGRNPATLAYTVAGVTDAALNATNRAVNSTFAPNDAVSAQESAPSVHGARPGGTYFSLDGANNTDPYTVVGGPFPKAREWHIAIFGLNCGGHFRFSLWGCRA